VENRAEIMQYVLKIQYISMLTQFIQWICVGGFFHMHLHMQVVVV